MLFTKKTQSWAYTAIGIALTSVLAPQYFGSSSIFILFSICFLTMIGLAIPKPHSYGYTFFSILLFLGFWLKVVVQVIWAPDFVDPVGDFQDMPEEWDSALIAATYGAVGIMLPRLLQIFYSTRIFIADKPVAPKIPAWFQRRRSVIWVVTLLVIVALNLVNLKFAFYQVGMNPKLTLPFHLQIIVGWMVNIGAGLWISMLIFWDLRGGTGSFVKNMLAVIAEGLLSTTSTISRLVYLLHGGPYWFVVLEKWSSLRQMFTRGRLRRLITIFVIGYCLSVVIVFWLRSSDEYKFVQNYPPNNNSFIRHARSTANMMRSQFLVLFVHRWIGLEGILTVGALPTRNNQLLIEAITDNPKLGRNTLYQRAAKTGFLALDPTKNTFLANAGPVAILMFSGSKIIILLGLSVLSFSILFSEWLASRLVGNPFFIAIATAGLANVFSQMTFPYLSMIYLLQLWLAIGFFAILQRIGTSLAPAKVAYQSTL